MKKGCTILLIDSDSKNHYEGLYAALEASEIISIPDKPKAHEFFFHNYNYIDLVLLNHDDDGSCIKMLQFFKSLRPLIPVIVMTSNGSEEFAVKAFKCGADDYFKQPLTTDDFESRIKAILGIRYNNDAEGLDMAVDSIHKHYAAKITLPQIARKAGMSISLFNKEFKKKTGLTFIKYINNFRINKAASLLSRNGLSMNDIASACGFTNQYHFTRTFKKITKTSPRDFKRSLEQPP